MALARKVGAERNNRIQTNENGLPLAHSLFQTAKALSNTPFLCYVNADIAFLGDFPSVIRRLCSGLPKKNWILTGLRTTLPRKKFEQALTEIETGKKYYPQRFSLLAEDSLPAEPSAFDYFLFPKEAPIPLRPFYIGRPAWDNWILFAARCEGFQIIDATEAITAFHLKNQTAQPQNETKWHGPEALHNYRISGMWWKGCKLNEVKTHLLSQKSLKKASFIHHLYFFRYYLSYFLFLTYLRAKRFLRRKET